MVVSSASASISSPGAGRVPGFAKRVAECNEITPADVAQKYVPLVVDGHGVGLMRPAFAADLVKASEGVFALCRRRESSESGSLDDGDVERLTPDETARLLAGDPAALLATETRVSGGDDTRVRTREVNVGLKFETSDPVDGVVVEAPALQEPIERAGIASELEALVALHQKGALTDGEFAAAKAKLLG